MPDRAFATEGPRYAVAFSGGLDSTVLLAALVRIADAGAIRALHVDHGLHPDSAQWSLCCEQLCAQLGVRFVGMRITVEPRSGVGMEAAARSARYAALAERLDPDETLLTAHHADDQLETLLLRMLRGSGVRGMRGILPIARLGPGRVARPMLGFTRAEIETVARRWRLDWLEDPSNRSLDFDRNLIRARVAPILRERWGESAAHRAAALADAMRDAEIILEEVAARDLAAAGAEPGRVPLAPLRVLSDARQRNALRRALREAEVPMPNARRLEALRRAIGAGPGEGASRIEWRGAEARIHRDTLYLLAGQARAVGNPATAGSQRCAGTEGAQRTSAMLVSATSAWQGPEGRLVLEPLPTAETGRDVEAGGVTGLPESWAREGFAVRFRRGGERFKPPHSAHHRTLKAWLREKGVVPWMRDRIPLLYRGERLVAIADLTIDDDALRARPDEPRWRVRWLDRPSLGSEPFLDA